MTQVACNPSCGHDVGPYATCPVRTLECLGVGEAQTGQSQIRAYKLGKRRWSYNQCELLLTLQDNHCSSKQPLALTVNQAVLVKSHETGASCKDKDKSCVTQDASSAEVSYSVQLSNGLQVIASFYLVYPEPSSILAPQSSGCDAAAQTTEYSWSLVTRDHCKKGCQGPLLHPLRRFGVLGCRFNGPSAGKTDKGGSKPIKQSKYMYFAIDEAGTHVACKTFRLIAAIHDETGTELLGTACSQPIRVVANNDIPRGAAHIQLVATIRSKGAGSLPSIPRRPNVALWADNRLQQTPCDNQLDTPVCHPAELEPIATGTCFAKAAELPVQSGIPTADYRSTNTGKHQLMQVPDALESSSGSDEGLYYTGGSSSDASLGDHHDPCIPLDVQLAQQESEGTLQHFTRKAANLSDMAEHDMADHELEEQLDPVDTLMWRLESEPSPPSPGALLGPQPLGNRLSGYATSFDGSFLGGCSDLQDKGPGPIAGWNGDLAGQSYDGCVLDNPLISDQPSNRAWSSQQQDGTHVDPNDSRSQSMPDMNINSLKRPRCMHTVAQCGSWLTSCSSAATPAANKTSPPWRKSMRRGFLLSSATSPPHNAGSSSASPAPCAPVKTQASVRSSLGACLAQLEDQLERQANELRQQRALRDVLGDQLDSKQQEIHWLRNRVCQLQHGQYVQKCIAARASAS